MRYLAEDRSIIIGPVDKGLYVVISDREDYLTEGYRQLSDHCICTDVKMFNQKLLSDFTKIHNNL